MYHNIFLITKIYASAFFINKAKLFLIFLFY